MDEIEIKIRNHYKILRQPMARICPFVPERKFNALSQYGYNLDYELFNTQEEAEQAVVKYYRKHIKLIRQ